MKQVNLKEILLNTFIQYKADYPENRLSKAYTIEQFQNATEILTVGMNAMLEACNQTVDLCAENADIMGKKKSQHGKYRKWQNIKETEEVDLFSYEVQYYVNKDSILNTKKQII